MIPIKEVNSEEKKVSVIIPVYNVEDYVDRCMRSVVSQSYGNLEILVMEGKSEDNSLSIVKEWEKRDDRITVVSRRDGGLGPARNYALNMASGDYFFFVDSDDWIESDVIEKMMEIAESDNEIDIVMCDARKYTDGQVTDIIGPEWTKYIYDSETDRKIILSFASNFIWGKLYRKGIFNDNHMEQPALPFEDLAVFPSLIAVARKIAMCHGVYANYQVGRSDSLSQEKDTYKELPKVFAWAKEGLKKNGKYQSWRDVFVFSMFLHFRIICRHCLGAKGYADLKKTDPTMEAFFEDHFSKYRNTNYVVYGGFSLRWITQECFDGYENMRKHFCFTSIPAQMSHPEKDYELVSNATFREKCVNCDIKGELIKYIEDHTEYIFLMDFTQECTNLLRDNNGNYITNSEAMQWSGTADKEIAGYYERLNLVLWENNAYLDEWKVSCEKLIKKLAGIRGIKLFLVKNYFADTFIKDGVKINYITKYEKQNGLLKEMYEFFEGKCNFCHIIEPEEVLTYTDMMTKPYSPTPEYYNISYYRATARKIQEQLVEIR